MDFNSKNLDLGTVNNWKTVECPHGRQLNVPMENNIGRQLNVPILATGRIHIRWN
jgi:hypothetical protein